MVAVQENIAHAFPYAKALYTYIYIYVYMHIIQERLNSETKRRQRFKVIKNYLSNVTFHTFNISCTYIHTYVQYACNILCCNAMYCHLQFLIFFVAFRIQKFVYRYKHFIFKQIYLYIYIYIYMYIQICIYEQKSKKHIF